MTAEQIEQFERDNAEPMTIGDKAAALALALSPLVGAAIACALAAFGATGCATDNEWRVKGLILNLSTASVAVGWGEVDKIPPGGYYEHEFAVDMRPIWEQWIFAPETNALARAKVILDAREVPRGTNATACAACAAAGADGD